MVYALAGVAITAWHVSWHGQTGLEFAKRVRSQMGNGRGGIDYCLYAKLSIDYSIHVYYVV